MVVLRSKDGGHRCDARCYDARWLACRCVCGGKNHGVGLERALKSSGRDLSVYGDTAAEQAEGLRYELEHNTLSGKSFDELAADAFILRSR